MKAAHRLRAWTLAALAFVVALAALAPVLFFAVVLLAGPHSSLLPGVLQPVVLVAGWVALVGVPLGVARKRYLRVSRRPESPSAQPDPADD